MRCSDENGNPTTNPINKFLSLSYPVKSQNSVEFNEVFNIDLTDSFRSLNSQSSKMQTGDFDKIKKTICSKLNSRNRYLTKNVHLVDRRPLRWYQTLAFLDQDCNELKYQKEYILKAISLLKPEIKNITLEQINSNEETLKREQQRRQYYKKLIQIENALSKLQELRRKIICEITTAGYLVDEKNGVVSIYQIVLKKDAKPPLDPNNIAVVNDETWKTLYQSLTTQLLNGDNPLIKSPAKRSEIEQAGIDLASVQTYPIIINELSRLQNNIDSIDAEISSIQNDAEAVLAKLDEKYQQDLAKHSDLYNKDNAILQDAKNQLRQYYPYKNLPDSDPTFRAVLDNFLRQYPIRRSLADFEAEMNKADEDYKNDLKTKNDKASADCKKSSEEKIIDCNQKKTIAQKEFDSYNKDENKALVLLEGRSTFLFYWNNPNVYDIDKSTNIIDANSDPMQKLFNDLNQSSVEKSQPYKIHQFTFKGSMYYDQDARSLKELMQFPNLNSTVVVLPCVDQDGQISDELFHVIAGPRKAIELDKWAMPEVKIVETHLVNISWQGHALGSLMETINLAPRETKHIVISNKTKITTELNQSTSSSSEEHRNVTSSFEDNLSNELSSSYNKSRSDTNTVTSKNDQNTTQRNSNQNERDSSNNSSVKADAHGSFLGGSFSVNAEASKSSADSRKSAQSQSVEAAIAASQSRSLQSISNTSRETSAKLTQNQIRKVAAETSSNNRMEVKSISSEQLEQESSNKIITTLTNPNDGRSINYNLFQEQNVYQTEIFLKDVKLVVNTGRELVEGSGIYDICAYELELFNKIFKHTNKTASDTLMCAFIARNVLKNYTSVTKSGSVNDGILKVNTAGDTELASTIAELATIAENLDLYLCRTTEVSSTPPSASEKQNSPSLNSQSTKKTVLSEPQKIGDKLLQLKALLLRLQKYNFTLTEKALIDKSEYAINAPACHMDVQLGFLPATEPYLESQRQEQIEYNKNINSILSAEASRIRGSVPTEESGKEDGKAPSSPRLLSKFFKENQVPRGRHLQDPPSETATLVM